MKIILVLLDGLGDRSYDILGHRTPLEAARTVNMDRLAAMGATGLFHASVLGECLPSETAHYLLWGYDRRHFPGRGLLEAVGEGVPFEDTEVLCLSHFVEMDMEKGVPVLRGGRDDIKGTAEELAGLYRLVSDFETDGIRFRLHQTRRNDGILVISGDVSPHISDSDPISTGKAIARVVPLFDNPEPVQAARTADAVNLYLAECHRRLKGHPVFSRCADFLVTQRCGRRVKQVPFYERWGLKPKMIASGSVYGGLAHELGFAFIRAEDSADPGRDLRRRIRRALEDKAHDFIHVHSKIPDEAAHKGDPILKKQAIEALDTGLGELVDSVSVSDDILAVITADHSTPSRSLMIHSGEPVPLVIAGVTVRRDRVDRFDEVSAASGCLGVLRGSELMRMILNFADRAGLSGLCLGDRKTAYMPDAYPPFLMDPV